MVAGDCTCSYQTQVHWKHLFCWTVQHPLPVASVQPATSLLCVMSARHIITLCHVSPHHHHSLSCQPTTSSILFWSAHHNITLCHVSPSHHHSLSYQSLLSFNHKPIAAVASLNYNLYCFWDCNCRLLLCCRRDVDFQFDRLPHHHAVEWLWPSGGLAVWPLGQHLRAGPWRLGEWRIIFHYAFPACEPPVGS
jgi:hypothetical protein